MQEKNYKQLIIPHNHRGYQFHTLYKAKVFVKDGNVVYSSLEEQNLIKNIPYLNTSILILGKGTSITSEAMNYLLNNKTIVMFVTNNFNLHGVAYPEDSLNTNKYARPLAKYIFDENKRLKLAKRMLLLRYEINQKLADKNEILKEIYSSTKDTYEQRDLSNINSIEELLGVEGYYTKEFRNTFKNILGIEKGEINEEFNKRVKLINSLMYGLASIILTAFGLPLSFNVFHGRTNKGALKYDIADLFKGVSVMLASISLFPDFEDFYIANLNEEQLLKEFSNLLIKNFDIISLAFEETHNLLKEIESEEI